ncbi:MAG: hypothetical protein V1733_04025 [bacterium]
MTPVSISGPYPGYCANADPVAVIVTPPGGVLNGSGIVGQTFYPNLTALDSNKIIYIYTSPDGCVDSDTLVVYIYPIPKVSLPPVSTAQPSRRSP